MALPRQYQDLARRLIVRKGSRSPDDNMEGVKDLTAQNRKTWAELNNIISSSQIWLLLESDQKEATSEKGLTQRHSWSLLEARWQNLRDFGDCEPLGLKAKCFAWCRPNTDQHNAGSTTSSAVVSDSCSRTVFSGGRTRSLVDIMGNMKNTKCKQILKENLFQQLTSNSTISQSTKLQRNGFNKLVLHF